jgi:RsiW-degrading membrane proteinase PrsW (M82 family)
VDSWLIFIIALAPGIFWLWFFYRQDCYEPEPLSLVAKMYFLGMVAAGVALFLENILVPFIPGLLFSTLAVPVTEELAKFSMVVLFVYRDAEFDEPMDGIVYATATALGFATLENFLYVLPVQTLPSLFINGTFRAVLSVPGHALFAVFWGFALGIAKFRPPGKKAGIVIAGLALAIAVHGFFNLLLDQSYSGLAVLLLLILPCIWWIAEKHIRTALLSDCGYAPAALKEK